MTNNSGSDVVEVRLCPAQQRAFEVMTHGLRVGSILRLSGGVGRGKTTVLRQIHRQVGGAFLNLKDFVQAALDRHPLALEETLYQLVVNTLKSQPAVILDDLHLLDLVTTGCHFHPRTGYFNAMMTGLCTYTQEAGKTLIFSTCNHVASHWARRLITFYALETVKENKQHYETAAAQALLRPKPSLSGIARSFLASRARARTRRGLSCRSGKPGAGSS